jgi:hypothetical protein
MTIKELKSNLHHLIDKLGNTELLEEYYNEIKSIVNSSKHRIWDSLTEDQKKEVLLSFDESNDESNLIDNEEVMNKYKKWL